MVEEVSAAFRHVPQPYELVFVDDASTDDTWHIIQQQVKADSHIRALRHAVNSGQSAALWTGIQNSSGLILATLDGDLQNDPADLPRLLSRLDQYDFVCGHRAARQDSFVRKISSRIARWARRAVLKANFADTGCALRVFKRTALEGVFPFNGLHRFLPILVQGNGARTIEVPVNHRPRRAGVSKYGVWNRLGRGIYDLIGLSWYQKRRLPKIPLR